MTAVIKRISWTAETQHGYVTRAQAIGKGATDKALHRAVASGVLQRVGHGVYRIVGAQKHRHQQLWVAWLQLATDRTAYEREGTRRAGVALVDCAGARSGRGRGRRARVQFARASPERGPDVRIHRLRSPLDRQEWHSAAGMPITTDARTIADLTRAGADASHIGSVFVDALEGGIITRADLVAALGDRPDPAGEIASMVEQATGKFVPR